MIDFNYEVKTKIYFGHGKEKEVGDILTSYKVKKVTVVIGMNSVKKTGLLDVVIAHGCRSPRIPEIP